MSTTTRTARIACAREHPHLERGVFEVAELAHQPLGVERPAFAVARDEAEHALDSARACRRGTRPARPAGDGRAPPRGSRCSPPSTAGSGSRPSSGTTCGRAGRSLRSGPCSTSRPRRRAARSSPRTAAAARAMSKCVPLSSEIVWSMSSWFQRWNSSTPSIGAVVVGVEVLDHLVDRRAGQDALADAAHRVLDAVQLLPTPRVRLLEVEVDAVEVAREQRVALARRPDRADRPRARTRRAGTRRAARSASVATSAAAASAASLGRRAPPSARKNGSSSRSPPQVAACSAHASAWRRADDDTLRDALAQRRLDARERVGNARHALGRDLPVVRRCRTP